MVRKGERYRASTPLEVLAMTKWTAPFTGGHDGILPAGEEFIIASDPPATATAVYCAPVRYDELHAHFVPENERSDRRYTGYHLCVPVRVIVESCERAG